MDEPTATKLRIKSGSFELEFRGAESFLRSDVPKLVKTVNDLRSAEIKAAAALLKSDLEEAINVRAELEKEIAEVKSNIESLSEMGEMTSLRLQMAMDRLSKMMSTLSNILKKISDTSSGIVQNLK
jgi:predicted  nucleic acid-binding Zn-ribbon protein